MTIDSGRRTALLIVTILCAACGAADAPEPIAKPQYGAWGFDRAGVDPATAPGDDFFRYANGTWLTRTDIPPDKTVYSLRIVMSDAIDQRLHDLMEQLSAGAEHEPRTTEGKIGAFYKSFMDEPRVERLGAMPLAPLLDEVRTATSRDRLAALMGRSNADLHGSLFSSIIDVDLKDPNHYALYIGQGGLGLPDRDYYLQPSFAAQKTQYQQYVARLLDLIAWPDAARRAGEIVALETRIADASWTKVQQRDPVAVYNPMSVAELGRLAPGFPWATYLKAGTLEPERVVVMEKSALPKIAAIFAAAPIATLQAWMAANAADNAAPYLSRQFVNAFFELHDKGLGGQQELAARWRRGVKAISGDFGSDNRFGRFGTMGFAVGESYTARHFPPEAKARIETLVGHLKKAYRARIETLEWMGPATKAEALKKLDTYTIKVGYPDRPRDYSTLSIRDDDALGNVRRAGTHEWAFYAGRFRGPVDRTDWLMTPQTNNAYNGSLRDIVFPAGILQPPIFDANADPAINFGAAGAVIGHELTHGFDDQGRKIDADGTLRDWWTPDDAKAFVARAARLSAQYSQFEALPSLHVNGDLTLGENIADLGGVALALDAYRASLEGKTPPVIDGLTGDQRVLLGWAQAWRGKLRDDAVRKQVASDPHSPRQFRVNGVVRNLDAWYPAFEVKAGQTLFLAPADRVRIW